MLIVPRRRLLLYPASTQRYLDRLTAADVAAGSTQGLEVAVTDAINNLLQALITAGFLGISGGVISQAASAIKTGNLGTGARTRVASLTPYAEDMPLPTSFNFGEPDYNRRTGSIGNGTSKYVDLNFNNNLVGQNSHQAAYVTAAGTQVGFQPIIGGGATVAGTSLIMQNGSTGMIFRNRNSSGTTVGGAAAVTATGFIGHSRSGPTAFTYRINGTSVTVAQTAETPANAPTFLYARTNAGAPSSYAACRIGPSSVGANIDAQDTYQSILDTYMAAIAAAIP